MLQTTTNINVDFYDKKYILVNAKQLDRGKKILDEGVDVNGETYSRWVDDSSRYLSVTCYNQGNLIPLNSGEHAAYIRYKKPDGHAVFNFCQIDNKSKIIVGFTEQMLVVEGICVADLVIVDKGKARVNLDTGEIVNIDETAVLSTMPIHIDVTEIPVNNSDIESTYEFNLLNTKLEEYWADFEDVVKTSRSWAVGSTGIRDGENTDNAKYYSKQSSNSANASKTSASNAANSESNANEYMNNAQTYMNNANTYMNNANTHMANAKTSETNAKTSESNAKISETNAKTSETNAKTSETKASASEVNAKTSETRASTSEVNAKSSETNALNSANRAQSYAVGGTGTRDDEDTNNAHYYYELIKNIVIGLDSAFIPMGTVSFAELSTVEKATGYMYNISNDFVTDNSFREGAGRSYTAGTNVYYTANGQWDCFGGAASPTATVSEVKDYLGI